MELLSSAKTLNMLHPELFERYAFLSNINKLCELQLSQDLPQELQDSVKEVQAELQFSEKDRNETINGTSLYDRLQKDEIEYFNDKDKEL